MISYHLTAKDKIGYYDAPYIRYEADQGAFSNGAKITPMSFSQTDLQCEASQRVCLDMTTVGSSVEWELEKKADGLVVRFSIPDGTTGKLDVYAENEKVGELELTTHWSWEYLWKNGNPNNVGVINDNPKMHFDEVRMKLPKKLGSGKTLKLVNASGEIHLDFIEMELVSEPITPLPEYMIYKGDGSDLQKFIDEKGGGKVVFIPSGVYNIDRELYFGADDTKLKGAGMWYSQLNFTSEKYLKGGLRANAKNIGFSDLALTTTRNSRTSSYKGINGVFTKESVIENLWVEHFECGAWIAQYNIGTIEYADGFKVINCRFRNNYADGINLCKGTRNTIVEHCNFRNNGDDDMAIWSANDMECRSNTFRYNTSENAWRSAGCAIYGGYNNKAHHILIRDNSEAGIKVNNAYPGVGFNEDGMHEFSDIRIERCGTFNDLFYNIVGAIDITSVNVAGNQVHNVKFSDITIIDACDVAIFINGGNGKGFTNLVFENILIDGTGREYPYNNAQGRDWNRGYGLLFTSNPGGYGTFCNIEYKNIGGTALLAEDRYGIGSFKWTESEECK